MSLSLGLKTAKLDVLSSRPLFEREGVLIGSVTLAASEASTLLSEALGLSVFNRIGTPERLSGLRSLEGIQFLFDERGDYLDIPNRWQSVRALRTHSPHTRATRSSAVKRVISWFDNRNLRWQDCTELAHMNLMLRDMRGSDCAKVSKSTWNQWMVHWYQFLKYAEHRGEISEIGFDLAEVKESGRSAQTVRALSPEEFRTFVAEAKSQRMKAGCAALLGTGIRVAELANLKLLDVPDPTQLRNFGRSYIPATILGKGQKTRTIYWPLDAVKRIIHYVAGERAFALQTLIGRISSNQISVENTILFKHRAPSTGAVTFMERPDAPLWLGENGDALSYNRWGKDFQQTSAALKSKDIYCSPHYLRHTYAIVTLSMLIKAQIRQELIERELKPGGAKTYFFDPLREVAARLGHSSIETTMIYLDHIASHRALISDAIADLQSNYLTNGKI